MTKTVSAEIPYSPLSAAVAALGATSAAHAQAVPSTPQVKSDPVAEAPSIPAGLQTACINKPTDGAPASKTCPVIYYGAYKTWIFSYADNLQRVRPGHLRRNGQDRAERRGGRRSLSSSTCSATTAARSSPSSVNPELGRHQLGRPAALGPRPRRAPAHLQQVEAVEQRAQHRADRRGARRTATAAPGPGRRRRAPDPGCGPGRPRRRSPGCRRCGSPPGRCRCPAPRSPGRRPCPVEPRMTMMNRAVITTSKPKAASAPNPPP